MERKRAQKRIRRRNSDSKAEANTNTIANTTFSPYTITMNAAGYLTATSATAELALAGRASCRRLTVLFSGFPALRHRLPRAMHARTRALLLMAVCFPSKTLVCPRRRANKRTSAGVVVCDRRLWVQYSKVLATKWWFGLECVCVNGYLHHSCGYSECIIVTKRCSQFFHIVDS